MSEIGIRPPEQQPQGNVVAVGGNGDVMNIQAGDLRSGNGANFVIGSDGIVEHTNGNGSHAHHEAEPAQPEAQTDPELEELNQKAEAAIFGAITYNDEGNPSKATFGKIDEIKNDKTFGATKKERLEAAEEYKSDYLNLTDTEKDGGEGLEPTQAKLALDARERDWPKISERAQANELAGMSKKEAQNEAALYYDKIDRTRVKDIKENKIYTPEAYSEMLAAKMNAGTAASAERHSANIEKHTAIKDARNSEGKVVKINEDGTYRHTFKNFERVEKPGTAGKNHHVSDVDAKDQLVTAGKELELYTSEEEYAAANALPVRRAPLTDAIPIDSKQDTVIELGASPESKVDDKRALPGAAIPMPAAPDAPNNPDDVQGPKVLPDLDLKKSREIKPDIMLQSYQDRLDEATEAYAKAVALQRNAEYGYTGDPVINGRIGRIKNWVNEQTGKNARRKYDNKEADDKTIAAREAYVRRYLEMLDLMKKTGVDDYLSEQFKDHPNWRAVHQANDFAALENKIFELRVEDAKNMNGISQWFGRHYLNSKARHQYATLAPATLATGVGGSFATTAAAGLAAGTMLAAPVVLAGGAVVTAVGAAEGRAIARRANKAQVLTQEAKRDNQERIEEQRRALIGKIATAAANGRGGIHNHVAGIGESTRETIATNKERVERASRRAGAIAAAGFAGTQLATRVTHAARGRGGHGNSASSQGSQNHTAQVSRPTNARIENVSANPNGTVHATIHNGDGIQRIMGRDLGVKPEKLQAATDYLDKQGFFNGKNLRGVKKVKGVVRVFSGGSDGKGGLDLTAVRDALNRGGFLS